MDTLAKNLLILASAGSGKTFQLSNRIIGLIARGADPAHVVALTFTRKAAAEFADSLLMKLANAAEDPVQAARLRRDIGIPDADFTALLYRVAASLHRITLGTMDSFFSKVVRGFQYELGINGGRFELIEGPQARIMADDILNSILGDIIARDQGDDFIHAFRRATIGRERQGVSRDLRQFVDTWHERYRHDSKRTWGPEHLANPDPGEWEKHKQSLAAKSLEQVEQIEESRKGQKEAYIKLVHSLAAHTIGSGSFKPGNKLHASLFEAVAQDPEGAPLTLQFYKTFTIPAPAADALREMTRLLVACETSAAVQRTRAIHELITQYDRHCDQRLRSQGKLGFSDVKVLMGQWASSEDARLRREAVDFRLDARIRHWLLDEFQDTSRADWNGLFPLIDEAAMDEEHSVFIVGDRKQAIYAWRGGDVSLFDEVQNRYQDGGLKVEPLDESWRSCPEVLALVNRICGDKQTMQHLLGDAAADWDCPPHVPAEPLTRPEKSGHARVETHEGKESRIERMIELLGELGVGQRKITCGILTRTNSDAQGIADELRTHGFDVIVDGHREPGRDTPAGIAVTQLLNWLADPANAFARHSVAMSPLGHALGATDTPSWRDCWNDLTAKIARDGYHHTLAHLLDTSQIEWSDFGRRRAQDVLDALASFDQQGGIPAGQAAKLLDQLQVSQSPGMAAVQVMTIHKSKGLGFDVVILPDLPSGKIPDAGHFDVAYGEDWLLAPPVQWVRELAPDLAASESAWARSQFHEALCTLYVALTRAKRGLYILLDHPDSKKHDYDKASFANIVLNSLDDATDPPTVIHESGSMEWIQSVDLIELGETAQPAAELPNADDTATSSRRLLTPSKASNHATHSVSGMLFGNEVHELLETVGWIDEGTPQLPGSAAGKVVSRLLEDAACRKLLERDGRDASLLREQALDAIVNGQFISGVIDRLHLIRDKSGKVIRAEIIDFKTDACADPADLADRYRSQLLAYRNCIQQLHPNADIRCVILSTHHQALIDI